MAFSIKNSTTALDDFIIQCDDVPIWKYNRDYSPIIPEFSMTVSQFVSEALIEEDQPIDVYYDDDTYPVFTGYVIRKQYKTEKRAYEVSVIHNLAKLRNYYVTYANLHSALATGATAQQYLASDNQGYPSTQLLWVMQKMFTVAGLVLDGQDIEDIFIEQIVADGDDRDILFQHLRLDENMLYAINQPVACAYSVYDLYPDYVANRITFWDFIQAVCSAVSNYNVYDDYVTGKRATGIILRNTISTDTTPTAGAIRMFFGDNTPYNITSGAVTQYDEDTIKPNSTGCRVEATAATSRAHYAGATEQPIYSAGGFTFGDGETTINQLDNFIIIYETFWLGDGYTGSNALTARPPMHINLISAECFGYDITKVTLAPINLAMALYAKSLSLKVTDATVEFEQEIIQEITEI